MLNKSDLKYLKDVVGRQGAVRQVTLFCAAIGIFVGGLVKFYLATLWCHLTGHSFHDFLVLWLAGTSASATYSGNFIMAADDLMFGMFCMGMAVLYAGLWWNGRCTRERMQRIVNALKSSGGIG